MRVVSRHAFPRIGGPTRIKAKCRHKKLLEMNIPHVASLLGIDPVKEPQYLWIANMAASAEVDPNEWKEFTNDRGMTMYYNLKLKVWSICMQYWTSENSTNTPGHFNLFPNLPETEGIPDFNPFKWNRDQVGTWGSIQPCCQKHCRTHREKVTGRDTWNYQFALLSPRYWYSLWVWPSSLHQSHPGGFRSKAFRLIWYAKRSTGAR